jgi:hypothetical protein
MPAPRKLGLAEVTRTYRGQKFLIRECDTDTYDKCLKQGTDTVSNPLTGEDEERVDETRVLRLLLLKSIVSPPIESLGQLGARLTRQLERDVRDLHFGMEPLDKKESKDDEDDDSPNESPAV